MITQFLGDEVERRGGYIAETMDGANDGIVTTFAVVAGVVGTALDPAIVLILGVANVLADGFSMGMSNNLSHQSAIDFETTHGRAAGTGRPPANTALVTLLAVGIAGWAPILPYGFSASRSLVIDRRWYYTGAEMCVVGIIAATVAFAAGMGLRGRA